MKKDEEEEEETVQRREKHACVLSFLNYGKIGFKSFMSFRTFLLRILEDNENPKWNLQYP